MRLVKDMMVGQRKEPSAVRPCVGGPWKEEQILRGKPVPLNRRTGGKETIRSGEVDNKDEKTHDEDALKPRGLNKDKRADVKEHEMTAGRKAARRMSPSKNAN